MDIYENYYKKYLKTFNVLNQRGGVISNMIIHNMAKENDEESKNLSGYELVKKIAKKDQVVQMDINFDYTKVIEPILICRIKTVLNVMYYPMYISYGGKPLGPIYEQFSDDKTSKSTTRRGYLITSPNDIIVLSIVSNYNYSSREQNMDDRDCIYLICGPKRPNDIYINYIEAQLNCFENTTDKDIYRKPGVGSLLMELIIDLSKTFRFKILTLLDNSTIKCNMIVRSFKKAFLTTSGHTWYARYGFTPYGITDDITTTYNNYAVNVFTLMNDQKSTDIINKTKLIDKGFIADLKTSLQSSAQHLTNANIERLVDGYIINLQQSPDMPLAQINKTLQISECENEIIASSAITAGLILSHPKGFDMNVYSKMALNL